MLDFTDEIVAALNAETGGRRVNFPPQGQPSSHPKAALIYAKMVAHRTDQIRRNPSAWPDISHALNSQAFAASLAYGIEPNITTSFEEVSQPEDVAAAFYRLELLRAINRHQTSALRFGLWRQYYDPDGDRFEIRLTRRRRRSALRTLNGIAQFDLLDHNQNNVITKGSTTDDAAFFAFASSDQYLRFIKDAHPRAWETFSRQAGFTTGSLTAFSAFLVFLEFAGTTFNHSLWFDHAFLAKLCAIFRDAWQGEALSDDELRALVELFSLTPLESAELSLSTPFFRFGDHFLRYHGFAHVMAPAMGLLTIAVRKHEKAWNDSVGSILSFGADALARSLPVHTRTLIATRRRIKGSGDIDLALFDVQSQQLLVCEVKTVYDKHRTVHQMNRFEEAKVGLGKATEQLRRSMAAVTSGALTTSDLFGISLPQAAGVHGALVTWVDPVDLTMDTADEDLLSINFATLRYLLARSAGDVAVLVRAIHELRNIWCASTLRPVDIGQPTIRCDLEVQYVDTLDAESDLASLNLSLLTLQELSGFDRLEEDWRADSTAAASTRSYIEESRAALRGR